MVGGKAAGRVVAGLVALGALLAVDPAVAQDPSASLAVPGALDQVTLEQAIALADRVMPAVVQARANIRKANATRRVAVGNWMPSLNANSTGGYIYSLGAARVDPVTGQPIAADTRTTTVNFGVNSSIDLFTGFRRGADSRAAAAGMDAAESGLINTSFQQRLATTQQFFTALGQRQIVEVREAAVVRADEQLKAAVIRLRAGSATRSDSLRSLVTLGNAQVALVQSQADLAAAEAALGRFIGADRRVRATDDTSFYSPVVMVDTIALLAEAKSNSPQVQNTAALAEQARAQLKASKSTYWPQLALSGSWTYNGNNQNDFGLNNQRQATISLNWPIFNKFVRERNVDLQVSNLEVAVANAEDAERQVESALIGQFAQLDAARMQIQIAQTNVRAAQEDLRVIAERYRLGVATLVDLLVSQEALTQAELDEVTSRYSYLNAKAQIEAVIGRPL
jgi:outer membrane protein